MKKLFLLTFTALSVLTSCNKPAKEQTASASATDSLSADSAKAIAKEAWIYGYSIFYNYKANYLNAIDSTSNEFAGGFNIFKHYSKAFDYRDSIVVTPNNDTPYSWAALDVSAEPVVLEVPAVKNKRYYVMQLVDLYTFNYAYIGTRATGNKAGKYLIAGPDWKGSKPAGIDSVFVSETNLITILGRTELFNDKDMRNVVNVQKGYKLIPLHTYLKEAAPAAKTYPLVLPVWNKSDYTSLEYINVLNALLQYTSVDPSENELRKRFAKIGIVPGQKFDSTAYTPEILAAIKAGIVEGEKALKTSCETSTSSLHMVGRRADLNNNYLVRATAAAMGLYGNTKEEAVYSGSMFDSEKQPLSGENKYTLRFTKDQIPPVDFFWSITLYNLPQRGLVKNPINRYTIGDRTTGLKYEKNGDLILYIQATSPGKDKEANWLPSTQAGPFNIIARLYGPKETVTNGTWTIPLPEKVK